MFALHKNIELKRDILEVLDSAEDFLSMKQITEILDGPTFNSVKQACSELKTDFEKLYKPSELEFIVSVRGGVKMKRYGVNIQRLTESMLVKDIVYPLLSKVLIQRSILTDAFLEEHYISRTAVYNRIRRLNPFLNTYSLHISISSTLYIDGDESQIRIFSYIFLFLAHRSIVHFPWVDNKQSVLTLTDQIFDYLEIPISGTRKQLLAILILIVDNAATNHHSFKENDPIFAWLDQVEYPEKPDFISKWTIEDWQIFLFSFISIIFLNQRWIIN